ncbi:MAG TPA: hypothetical protein VGZ22_21320 [Isosphaeraceae bacterium]|jgi:hypothetical protein|nr:hypothetical protein [Isosphaeraceae bacterium]
MKNRKGFPLSRPELLEDRRLLSVMEPITSKPVTPPNAPPGDFGTIFYAGSGFAPGGSSSGQVTNANGPAAGHRGRVQAFHVQWNGHAGIDKRMGGMPDLETFDGSSAGPGKRMLLKNGPMEWPGGMAKGPMMAVLPGLGPIGLPGATPLSKDAVGQLKQAVDTFAQSYTSGANASQDQAAIQALQTSLKSLFSSVHPMPNMPAPPVPGPGFETSHDGLLGHVVLSKATVTQIQQAVDTFAQSFTSGANASADTAAVAALKTSLFSAVASSMPTMTTGMGVSKPNTY